jgi:calcineurin-like phosphoesterase family protein
MRFFTADLHLGHANIVGYSHRPYASVAEMNDALIASWNATVGPEDEVWVLGDVALGRITETLPLVADLAGRKHLVPGNHDRCWPGHRRVRPADVQMYEDVGFEIHPGEVTLTIDRRDVLACHFPVAGDSHDQDRFADHRPHPRAGEWLLHGHVHEKWRLRGQQVNVGVDVWDYRPVPESEIVALMHDEA